MADTNWSGLFSDLAKAGVNIYAGNQAAGAAATQAQIDAANALAGRTTTTTSQNTAPTVSRFTPVGITTRFGKTGFTYGGDGVATAGYQVAPDVAAMREAALGIAGQGLRQTQQAQDIQQWINNAGMGLFNLGAGYLAQTPQQAAQQYMQQQQQLLAPGREQQLAALQNQQFQRGRSGLAVGATQAGYQTGAPGLQATNPQMAAYYNALAQQDANLAAQAMEAGQRQTQFGQGLMGGGINLVGQGFGLQKQAFSPFETAFGAATGIENQALNALQQSIALSGGRYSSGGGGSSTSVQTPMGQPASPAQYQNAFTQNRNAQLVGALADPVAKLIGSIFS